MATAITLDEVLEQVETKFLFHLPESELVQPDRLVFWIQEASWFYEDFFADNNPHLPKFALKSFTKAIFNHCPLFSGMSNDVDEIFRAFGKYRSKIPRHGCIILNPDMEKVLLVCQWGTDSWTFPRGKVNENETPVDCAIREVLEETGFDVSANIHHNDVIRVEEGERGSIELFIVTNVPESTKFVTKARKEVSKIEFFNLNSLPKGIFGVKQFLPELRKWIKRRKQRGSPFISPPPAAKVNKNQAINVENPEKFQKILVNEKAFKKFDNRNVDTFQGEDAKRWSVDEMFAANSQLTGKNYKEYDGNPHTFGSSHPRYIDYNNGNFASPELGRSHNISTSNDAASDNNLLDLACRSEEFQKIRSNSAFDMSSFLQLQKPSERLKGKDMTQSDAK